MFKMAESNNPHRNTPAFEKPPCPCLKPDEITTLKDMVARHEAVLSSMQGQREMDASRQLEVLQEIRDELASHTTPLQFIGSAMVQMTIVITAFVFGLFTIFGVVFQIESNVLAQQQNQINLIAFCQTVNSVG